MNSTMAGMANIFILLLGLMLKIILGKNSPVMSTISVEIMVWQSNTIKSLLIVSGSMLITIGSNSRAMAIP